MKAKSSIWLLAIACLAIGMALPRTSFAGKHWGYVKAIKAGDAAWARAANAKDFDALAGLYGEGAMLMPPGHTAITGHDNIAAFWKSALNGVSKVELHYKDLHGMGAYAFRTGMVEMHDAKGATLGVGKFVEVWHRGAHGWKLYRDIFNMNPAPEKDAH